MNFLLRAVISAAGLWLASRIVPGVRIDNTETLIAAVILLGVANAIVRPILVILTLPITLVTLGLFLLVVNAAMIGLVGLLLHGFHVGGFGSAILVAIVTGLVSWAASGFIGGRPGEGRNRVPYERIG